MKNHTLSLLIGAALTIPAVAMAAPTDTNASKKSTATAEIAVEADVASTGSETDVNTDKTTKMTPFSISETQKISRARVNVNNNLDQQPITTEIKAPAEALQDQGLQTTEIISQDPVLDTPEDLAEVSEEDEL
ncbi:hypothetical protein [Psychrobacter sp.]|uniref:hypothetical protein n=1 Tax=Psychrobacter sp. TaxID=56811 RepID=UPI003561E385